MPELASPTNPVRHPIFSFANGEMGPVASGFIRAMEKVTGQPKIKKLYFDYVDDERPSELFWTDALERLNISYNLHNEATAQIPRTGRLLIVANHPFGVIDGLVLCSMLSKIRDDYRIITHQVLRQAPAVMDKILPIDFAETPAALATNLNTRTEAQKFLKSGGAVIVFPAGGISLAPNFIGPAFDVEWKTFAAKLAQQQDTTVIPFFFHGRNSVLYQMARRMSVTLGYSLMFREICKQMNSEVHVTMRAPIKSDALSALTTRQEIIEFLRKRTYGEK
ncbi:MAG: lysophospholipid acyltransferase family protein [Candidatus Puniceispirillaceae bacterium]|jgi:putative hemolysin|nr:lysophospholipid acyltransferase family protein [Pseudomonadota bacterium]